MKCINQFELISKISDILKEYPDDNKEDAIRSEYKSDILRDLQDEAYAAREEVVNLQAEMFTHGAIEAEGFRRGLMYAITVVEQH